MPNLDDLRLGQLSVAQGLCQPGEVEECLSLQLRKEQDGSTQHLGELLIARGYITRSQLTRIMSLQSETEQKVSRIGPYELIRKLGEGGMGAVFQANDTRSNRVVALKVLPRSRAKDATFLQRFEAEARAAFELDHPNIVHGLDVGQADGYHFLVMEFVDGHDVFHLLEQNGRLSEKEALAILEQIASALEHIHGEKLVHRDIKPENIIVTREGIAKLADMGLALDNEAQGRRRITQAGIAMGTPFYLSPEQIEGKTEPDIRSDIYSLATTIYEMVTGRPPFEGETPAVVMMKHLNEQVPSPHDLDHTISIHFCHLLERMMAKDPNERYQTPTEMIVDIQRVKQGVVPLGTRPPAGRSSIARPLTHRDRGTKPVATPPPQPRVEVPQERAERSERVDRGNGSSPDRPAATSRIRKSVQPPSLPNIRARSERGLEKPESSIKLSMLIGLAVAVAVLAFLLVSMLNR